MECSVESAINRFLDSNLISAVEKTVDEGKNLLDFFEKACQLPLKLIQGKSFKLMGSLPNVLVD